MVLIVKVILELVLFGKLTVRNHIMLDMLLTEFTHALNLYLKYINIYFAGYYQKRMLNATANFTLF